MVDNINDIAVKKMSGEEVLLISADSVHSDNDDSLATYPMEFLNTLNIPGMASHSLILKVGCPVVLLRNINPFKGLCNGTRLIVSKITKQVLTCKIMNGSHIGEMCLIPRIDLLSQEGQFPMIIKRRQFPVKLAFAMTINKSQGQSLRRVGVYLPEPVFGHGQLYVALSRCCNAENVKVFIEKRKLLLGSIDNRFITKNIVYKEVLH
jgi:ATP-dependent DNA helicase PIF1